MADFAVLCPGQGSQSPAMFDMALTDEAGRHVLEACSDAVKIDLVARAHAGDDLFANAFAQPALVASALATWAMLAPHLPEPSLFAGYSVGELSAWGCAGAWGAAPCAVVAATRAHLMNDHTPPDCGMLAVRGLRESEVMSLADDLHTAIINDSDHFVLAGRDMALSAAADRMTARGATTRRLDVRVPSHTPILRDAAVAFATFLTTAPLRDVSVPVLRGIDGHPCRRGSDGAAALEHAIAQTIRWDRCQQQMIESGVRVMLELGPGRALTRIAAEGHPDIAVRSVSDFRSTEGVVQWLSRQLEG